MMCVSDCCQSRAFQSTLPVHEVWDASYVDGAAILEFSIFLHQIKLFCMHPVKMMMMENKLEVHKDKTLREATEMAYKVSRACAKLYLITQ